MYDFEAYKMIHDFMSEVIPNVILGEESHISMDMILKGYRAMRKED
jgi:hypothetical protein